ncbi:MAG: polysaccharide biosynthesis/export family protein [Alphaproteobacteria bacterium]|nr:polysaccharide biosynthesis/export family protein [Alphaproteobacteria bacterium]
MTHYLPRSRPLFLTDRRRSAYDTTARLSRWLSRAACTLFVGVCAVFAFAIYNPDGFEATADSQFDYIISQQDKLRISVHQWQPSRASVFEWEALTGEYKVGPTGNIALPIIGQIRAVGRTADEVGKAVGKALKARIGLASVPDSVVDVVEFGPVYIAGVVDKPGEYPYRPGLNVLQALSISGGFVRAGNGRSMTRDMVRLYGSRDTLEKQLQSYDLTIARLQAEIAESKKVDFSGVETGAAGINRTILNNESRLFAANQAALETEQHTLVALKARLKQELDLLSSKIIVYEKQIKLSKEQAEGIAKLKRRGLTTQRRLIEAERVYSQDQVALFNLLGTRSRLHQSIAETELALVKLKNTRYTAGISELRNAQVQREQTMSKLVSLDKEIQSLEQFSPEVASDDNLVSYWIVRPTLTGVSSFQATETSQLRPGDTLQVKVMENSGISIAGRKQKQAPINGMAYYKQGSPQEKR